MITKTLRRYYYLTKPGIIRGNLMVAAAAFLLASQRQIDWWHLLETLVGIGLVIGSACVFNNYVDRSIDAKMERTSNRALVKGWVSDSQALIFGTLLGLLGFAALIAYTNWLTVAAGLIAYADYIVLYGLAKRRSIHGTLVGSIAGAMPPAAAYMAVSDRIDVAAILLFVILTTWQMPHFYAIAIYRFDDYKRAGLPVLPVKRGLRATKTQILAYIAAFLIANLFLVTAGKVGWTYLVVVGLAGLAWFTFGWSNLKSQDDSGWARKMFFISLVILLIISLLWSLNAWLP